MSRTTLTLAALSQRLGDARRGLARPVAVWRAGVGRTPHGLDASPEPLFPGDALRGRAMLGGRWIFDGEVADGPGAPWSITPPSDAWAGALHGFGWLAHLAAIGDAGARRGAQAAVQRWIARHGRGAGAPAWRPHVVGRRIDAWLEHSELILGGADPRARRAVLRSLARQTRFLRSRWNLAPEGAPRLQAAAGLVFSGLRLEGFERGFLPALRDFESELEAQLTLDGGHRGRRPSELFEVFALATRLRRDLDRAGGVSTAGLTEMLGRMAPTLRMLRLGDGGLALFNGGRELGDGRIDYALAEARAAAPASRLAPESGFGRLAAGRVTAALDAGAPGPGAFSTRAGAGLLAFEASVGQRRLIVSCGPGEHLGPDWARAGRRAAAFSTLGVEDGSPLDLLDPDSFAGRAFGARALPPFPKVSLTREETADGAALTASHDGWGRRFGLIHRRMLLVTDAGGALRGEDTLSPAGTTPGRGDAAFAIRFHLHPEVEAKPVGGAVALRLPAGEGWTFRQKGGEIALEESVYLGGPYRRPRATQQIVVSGRVKDYQGAVNWTFRRS